MKKVFPWVYFFTPTALALAHHDDTGADVATTDSSNFILIGIGILVTIALMWIIFSKPKK